jgi:hypothetical protein
MDASIAAPQRAPTHAGGAKPAASPLAPPFSTAYRLIEEENRHPAGVADDVQKNAQSLLLPILDGL